MPYVVTSTEITGLLFPVNSMVRRMPYGHRGLLPCQSASLSLPLCQKQSMMTLEWLRRRCPMLSLSA